MSILNYFFAGFLITFLLDYISEKYGNNPSSQIPPQSDWGWGPRIVLILIWPIGLFIFIKAFLIAYFKK